VKAVIFNPKDYLDGDVYPISLAGEALFLQVTSYVADYLPEVNTSFIGLVAVTEAVATSKRGPTAVCLYTSDYQPFATLSLNLPQSKALREGIFYGKDYAENAQLFQQMLEAGYIERVTGYPLARAGYAGLVDPYRLTDKTLATKLTNQPNQSFAMVDASASTNNQSTDELIAAHFTDQVELADGQLLPARLFETDAAQRQLVLAFATKNNGTVFTWKSEGDDNWLERGIGWANRLNIVVVPDSYTLADSTKLHSSGSSELVEGEDEFKQDEDCENEGD